MKLTLNKTLMALGISAFTAAAWAQDSQHNASMSAMDNGPMTSQMFVTEAATTDMKEVHMGEMALQKSDNADVKKFARHMVSEHKSASKKLAALAQKKGLSVPDTNSMMMEKHSMAMHDHNSGWNSNRNSNAMMNTNSTANPSSAGIGHENYKGAEVMQLGAKTGMTGTNTDMAMGEQEPNCEMLSGAEFNRAFAAMMVKGHQKAIAKFEAASMNLQDADLKKYAQNTLPTLREHHQMAMELQSKVGAWSNIGSTNTSAMNQNSH